jgi:hypothetical protein
MATDVSLMLIPSGQADSVPQVLMFQGGLWRDMSPSMGSQVVGASTVKRSIEERLTEMMSTVDKNLPVSSGLRTAFEKYYEILAPLPVRQALAEAAVEGTATGVAPLLRLYLHSLCEWVPWELFFDGTNFLGLRFQIARLPFVPRGPDIAGAGPRPVRRIYSFLAENVFDEEQRDNWKATFNGFAGAAGREVRRPPLDDPADAFPTLDDLQAAGDADIIHVTCHGAFEDVPLAATPQKQFIWTLNHLRKMPFTYHITSQIVEGLALESGPLVFGNACSSAAGAGQAEVFGGLTPSFGAAFFAQGARNFIGTFAPITKRTALAFAPKFYELLLTGRAGADAGIPIGQTLLEVKKHFEARKSAAGDNDPSHLFYCLYGPPETTFTLA